VDSLEQILHYQFRDRRLLELALVHRSYLNESGGAGESNERLEFLGDAVLGFVVARVLYKRFPGATEGRLTELRAQLVRWETLGAVAEDLGLGRFLSMAKGEERSGGRMRPLNLARAYEAVVGAILLDGRFTSAQAFVLRTLKPSLDALTSETVVTDVKSRLQTWTHARRGLTPVYRTVETRGPEHARIYRIAVLLDDEVIAEGEGPKKRTAERAAAAAALQRLAGGAR
jgi:ribonuclease-3